MYEYVVTPPGDKTVAVMFLPRGRPYMRYKEYSQVTTPRLLMHPSRVGDEIVQNVARVYYRTSHFVVVDALEDPGNPLERILVDPPYSLNIRPYEHIREITINIEFDCVPTDKNLLSKPYHTLKQLDRIPNKDRLHLHFHLNTQFTDNNACEHSFSSLLEAVRYPLYDLIHANCNVSFTHRNGLESAYIRDQERYHIPSKNGPQNGANFFPLTTQECQHVSILGCSQLNHNLMWHLRRRRKSQ